MIKNPEIARRMVALFALAAVALFAVSGVNCIAENFEVEVVELPPLRISGQPARAHTQGLELADGKFFVTARREDVTPKRAILLRTESTGAGWDVWDLTPDGATDSPSPLDHPGGMQSDGERLWIPVSESRKNGRSLIRVFALNGMIAGKPLTAGLEFSVNDHIGALAVSPARERVLGASWDTEKVYVWNLKGELQRELTKVALNARGLGAGTEGTRAGIAIQDWKFRGARLIASGLSRKPGLASTAPKSRLLSFERFLENDFHEQTVELPKQGDVELAREGMAISDGWIYLLPEDLGNSNRLFRVRYKNFFGQ